MKKILINQLFSGEYLKEGFNIGHEIINLFCDDNGNNYIFVTPSGIVNKHNLESILFVQHIKAKKTAEVIMKAEGLTPVSAEEIKNISYAGTNIEDIFKKNIHKGKTDDAKIDIFVTYRADSISFLKKGKRIILTVDPDYKCDIDSASAIFLGDDIKVLFGQKMRRYLSQNSLPNIYNKIKNLLNNDSYWENASKEKVQDDHKKYSEPSFLEIIRRENDELVFSNLFSYYFGIKHKMFSKFAEEVLGVADINPNSIFEIKREYKNIDLWIEDKTHLFVIENKINSGINGRTNIGKTQLDKYCNIANEHIKKSNEKKAYFYIFIPNHNKLDLSDLSMKKQYKVITYEKIYDFFTKYKSEYIENKYFADFLKALERHSMTHAENRFNVMRSRFIEKINQA